MANVQISQELFVDLIKFHCMDAQDDDNMNARISKGLEAKLDSMVKRELYSKYKTAQSPAEREHARKEYLNKIGIPDSFRW